MSLLQVAREASGKIHGAIEETPLAKSLVQATIDRDTYSRLTGVMRQIHRIIEEQFERPVFQELPLDHYRRLNHLNSDFKQLTGGISNYSLSMTVDEWQVQMNELAETQPWVWLGALYVLEGSRMGSRMLLPCIARALRVPVEAGQGIDYHFYAVADRGQSWQIFKTFLENAQLDEAAKIAFAQGVHSTFQMLYDVYEDLSLCSIF